MHSLSLTECEGETSPREVFSFESGLQSSPKCTNKKARMIPGKTNTKLEIKEQEVTCNKHSSQKDCHLSNHSGWIGNSEGLNNNPKFKQGKSRQGKTYTDAIIESARVEGPEQWHEVHHHAQHGSQRRNYAQHHAYVKQRVRRGRKRPILQQRRSVRDRRVIGILQHVRLQIIVSLTRRRGAHLIRMFHLSKTQILHTYGSYKIALRPTSSPESLWLSCNFLQDLRTKLPSWLESDKS